MAETAGKIVGVVPYVGVSDAKKAAAFYEKALGATIVDQKPVEDGRLMHCEMHINGGTFMICDPFPEHGHAYVKPAGVTMHLVVDDAQAWWDRAIAAGCTPTLELHDAFWGDRYGQFSDPFDISWAVVGPK
jgi:PhnB protein